MKLEPTSYNENGSLYSASDLRRELARDFVIKYRANGSRVIDSKTFLPKALEAAKKIGVTRFGRISELIDCEYPVFGSTRPTVVTHSNVGVNTGGQGKGPTAEQALISCLMETLEGYCMEMREPMPLVRATYKDLVKTHLVLHPSYFCRLFNNKNASESEPLLWMPTYCPPLDQVLLTPAEALLFDLDVLSHRTRPRFMLGYSGFAAGGTYLDAAIHGFYEVIERKFNHEFYAGNTIGIPINPEVRKNTALARVIKKLAGEYDVQFYLLTEKSLPPIPMVLCMFTGPAVVMGWGCAFNFDTAFERAVSEAVQVYATYSSGAREDLIITSRDLRPASGNFYFDQPRGREGAIEIPRSLLFDAPITVERAKRISGHRQFSRLQAEYEAQKKWLNDAGYKMFTIANMTRRGIDIPVVKVLVPSLGGSQDNFYANRMPRSEVLRCRFRNIPKT